MSRTQSLMSIWSSKKRTTNSSSLPGSAIQSATSCMASCSARCSPVGMDDKLRARVWVRFL